MEEFNYKQTYQLLLSELTSWYKLTIKALPNIVVAMIVLSIFFFVAKGVRRLAENLIGRVSDNRAVTSLLATIIHMLVLGAGLFVTLGILNLDKTVTSLLAGAGVLGLILGFAFQELSANFISGIFIAFRKPFRVDDIIENNGHMGMVTRINLRATEIRTLTGQDIHIPNKDLLTTPVINYTNDPRRRMEISVGVTYDADLDKVERVVREALKEWPGCDFPDETKFYYQSFGDSSINFIVQFWIKFPGADAHHFKAIHNGIKQIKKAFDRESITIPFPIRTLDVDPALIEKVKMSATHQK